jgi:hypothetical protein
VIESRPKQMQRTRQSRAARVRTLVSGPHAPGDYSVTWDGTEQRSRSLSSGVYFYRLTAPDFTSNRKMVLLK